MSKQTYLIGHRHIGEKVEMTEEEIEKWLNYLSDRWSKILEQHKGGEQ